MQSAITADASPARWEYNKDHMRRAHAWHATRQLVRESIWDRGLPPADVLPVLDQPTNVSRMRRLVWNISGPRFCLPSVVYFYPVLTGQRTNGAVLYHVGHDWTLCRSATCPGGDCTAPLVRCPVSTG